MTNQHPITPPPELRRQWLDNDHFSMVTGTHDLLSITRDRLNSVIDQAAQWGADQELEACCEWLRTTRRYSDQLGLTGFDGHDALRTARRPKPPSLKEQALNDLDDIPTHDDEGRQVVDLSNIRRALEALDD
jgi:hypothetical protein